MKKNDWILIALTGIYSFLFYGEHLGLNLSIFTLLIIMSFIVYDREILKKKNWTVVALSCLLTCVSVLYLGNSLSILVNIISLLILAGMSMSHKTSVLFSLIHGAYSLISSPVYAIVNIKNMKSERVDIKKFKRKILIIGIPILITILFFFMYKGSNPIFGTYADKINFDWISWGWISFTLTGLVFLYGFINSKRINKLAQLDEVESLNIDPIKTKELKLFGKTILVVDEYFSGKLLFVLLNVLIAIVNLLDFNFIFITRELPEDLTFAEFLHQGVGMLVVSIAISIVIILFYFRGQLNFYKDNKTFKVLAYIWIIQNVFMLFSVCLKNQMYIESYGLTYKRIGIYVYSLLTLIGLITTILKVYKVKVNMYLVRLNGWTFYCVLLVSCLINWDVLIVNYNLQGKKEYDVYYLLSLSDSTIPALINLNTSQLDEKERRFIQRKIATKIDDFRDKQKDESWKSWNYQKEEISKALLKKNNVRDPFISKR
jgi:hypothetical protein